MRLVAVKFQHFRCLHNTDWLPIRSLTVFIGENDAGKSAALDGLGILFGVDPGTEEDISYKPVVTSGEREEFFKVSGEFSFGEGEEPLAGIPITEQGTHRLSVRVDAQKTWLAEGLVALDEDFRIDPNDTPLPALRALLNEKGITGVGGTSKEPFIQAFAGHVEAQPKVTAEIEVRQPRLSERLELVDFRDASDPVTVLSRTLRSYFVELVRLDETGSLLAAQQVISDKLQARANELTKFVQVYRPDVQQVAVTPVVDFTNGFRQPQVSLTDTMGNAIPIELRGEGLRAHLRLAAFEWSKNLLEEGPPKFYIFDEPDTHLDFHAQRRMLGILEGYSERGQVVVATHSMNLVNRVDLDQILHFQRDETLGTSSVKQGAAVTGKEALELNRIGTALGIENASFLYERAFLLFEGESEARAFPKLYELWTNSKWYLDGVRFVNGHNNEGAILFGRFLNTENRPVVVLVDEDTRALPGFHKQFAHGDWEKRALLPTENIHLVQPSCFELAFASECWAKAVKTAWNIDLDVQALESLRSDPPAFVSHLQRLTEASKPDLATVLVDILTKADIPVSIGEAFEHARTLATNK